MKRLLGYFLKGLLVVLPSVLTAYLLYATIQWVDRTLDIHLPGMAHIPGAGIVIVLVGVTIVGALFSGFIGTAIFNFIDNLLSQTPFVKIIYTSMRDLIGAFVGEKKKFTEPVLVEVGTGIQVVGFITRKSLQELDLQEKMAVYFPASYTFSGHLLIVARNKITLMEQNPTELMRFIISGGITGFQE